MEKFLILTNVNSSGQGYNEHHADNPHHAVLTKYGWKYSHTTPIRCVDGTRYARHSYFYPGTEWAVGIDCRPGFKAEAHKLGSGRCTSFFGSQLERYLKRKTRELRRS